MHPKPATKPAPESRVNYAKRRIAALDSRLGTGIGATRERARLAAILAPVKPAKA